MIRCEMPKNNLIDANRPAASASAPAAVAVAVAVHGRVRGMKYLKRLMPLFARLREVGCDRDKAGNRTMTMDQYCLLVMLYLFNPLIESMRLLQEAAALDGVAKKLGVKRFSAGAFSEAPAVFEPQRLTEVIRELLGELRTLHLPRTDPRLREIKHLITLVDSTLLATLPKLAATLCHNRRDGLPHHAWRLHTHLTLDCPVPERIDRTPGNNRKGPGGGGGGGGGGGNEVAHLYSCLEKDRCYVTDRGFFDAKLFNAINAIASSYVCAVRCNLKPKLVQDRTLSWSQAQQQSATAAGVVRDQLVQISLDSHEPSDHLVRLVELRVPRHPKRTGGKPAPQAQAQVQAQAQAQVQVQEYQTFLILTNLLDVPAEVIGLIYRYRWTIELFFRLLKQTLGCRHLLSHRPQGIDIQIYCALIAAILIHLQTGQKPDKRMMFLLGMYLAGWASEQEVIAALSRPDNTGVKRRAKDELWRKLGVQ